MKKRAVIVGGSSGIGLATVKKLVSCEFEVIVIYRERRAQAAEVENTYDQLRLNGALINSFNADATNIGKINEIIQNISEKYGQNSINLFLHSLSRGNLKSIIPSEYGELVDTDYHLTTESMGLNITYWVKSLFNEGLFKENSRVIALTSEGNKKYWPGYDAIAIAKATLETVVKYMAIELAPHKIQVNCIQAGVTDTPSLRLIPGSEKLIDESTKRNPYGRLTQPEDVANVIYLLSMEEANWINGSLIHVDGGEHLI